MQDDNFRSQMIGYLDDIRERVVTDTGDWTVKGFIDVHQRIYSISIDTKVLSKVLELLLFPVMTRFAEENDYRLVLARAQNHYPDLTFVSRQNAALKFAVDIKTTYRTSADRISGMTLGTFAGYFRNRQRPLNSTFAYDDYAAHYVMGVVYDRVVNIDERHIYDIGDIDTIPSVVRNFDFFFQEKYRIASDAPGSGNTTNIGSTVYLERLLNGTGVFADLGRTVFDDYWMHYQTRAMARDLGLASPPYSNLRSYQLYKQQGAEILSVPSDAIETEVGIAGNPPVDDMDEQHGQE